MTLSIFANEDNWQAFDDAWTDLIAQEGPIDDLLVALEIAGAKRRLSRCLPTLREHAEQLAASKRHSDAASLVGAAVRGGGPIGELAPLLLDYAQQAWGSEGWWNSFVEHAELRQGTPDLRKAWERFEEMRGYAVGSVVFHAAGWGCGEIVEMNAAELEVQVAFASGRKDRFPLRTAVEIFERLPETDLRVQALRDPEGLKKRVKNEPLEILRSVLLRYEGKASTPAIKNALMHIGVDGSAWTNWWRKARLAAENSEWFRVSGNAARAEVELLRRAVDPVEGLKRQLMHAQDLYDALARVRDLMGGQKLEPAAREAALLTLEELANDTKQTLESRLAVWMLLREHRNGSTPEELTRLLAAASGKPEPKDPALAPELWRILARIPNAREQEQSVDLLEEIYGEEWVPQAIKNFPHAAPGAVKPLIDRLLERGHRAELGAIYVSLLARPLRAPFPLIWLARVAEDGKLEGKFPTGVQRAQALIELAVHLEAERKGDALMTRAATRLCDLLIKGTPPLLETLLEDADSASLRSLRQMLSRGVDERLDTALSDYLFARGPEMFRAENEAFWKDDHIWTTRAGFERRDAELREITERKIPANAEAIARAASYGDLSENSEWENAISEQRMLTDTAASIERELRQAALLENATIPEGTVAPGTLVRYRESRSGEVQEIELLGPWDSHRPKAVSYRAPLAQGMLGLKQGGKAEVELPSGKLAVEILEIRMATL
ncbi:MAG: GreA/GreB family elongation factor [Planctomycetes bacterium]|jgi:transcription elongation factor GreA|nr:GreA/GreB family elongation factor [Planctomycetota bacterium]